MPFEKQTQEYIKLAKEEYKGKVNPLYIGAWMGKPKIMLNKEKKLGPMYV